jgi:sterol desaturase/sphingolipid hydroxylase (fatty acid hydroxylase superfamily)
MTISYDWQAALLTVGAIIAIVVTFKFLLLKIPAFKHTQAVNKQEHKRKWRDLAKKYHHRVKVSQKIGLVTNLVFFLGVLPFIVTLEPRSVGSILLDAFLVLMIYDFLYYMTHRFLFHGQGWWRRVHAVHHQARSRISSIDALLLHPAETITGLALFYVTTVAMMLVTGEPFHAATIIITYVTFTQLNQFNHCRVDLDRFPFRTLNRIAIMHDAHHRDMHKGNYATITLFYDWLFRTLEEPVEQEPLELVPEQA